MARTLARLTAGILWRLPDLGKRVSFAVSWPIKLVMCDWSDGCHVDLLALVTGSDTWQELLSA